MAGFLALKQFNESETSGKNYYAMFRKTVPFSITAGLWFDFSMTPGSYCPPQYYAAAPRAAIAMAKSTDGGFDHGVDSPTSSKYLKRFLIMASGATGLPMPYIVCDYLMYYPFIDTGTTDSQLLTNVVTLPRYTDGKGVKAMIVSVAANTPIRPTFNITYTNSDNVSGRVSPTQTLNLGTVNGTLLTSSNGTTITACPFVSLQSGDTGIKSVESVQLISGTDVGLFAIVLVKPLITGTLYEQTAPSEKVPLSESNKLLEIKNDAFLNLICLPQGNLSGISFFGELEITYT